MKLLIEFVFSATFIPVMFAILLLELGVTARNFFFFFCKIRKCEPVKSYLADNPGSPNKPVFVLIFWIALLFVDFNHYVDLKETQT